MLNFLYFISKMQHDYSTSTIISEYLKNNTYATL